jgi:hypothetical protein
LPQPNMRAPLLTTAARISQNQSSNPLESDPVGQAYNANTEEYTQRRSECQSFAGSSVPARRLPALVSMNQKHSRARRDARTHKPQWLQPRAEVLHDKDIAQSNYNRRQNHDEK